MNGNGTKCYGQLHAGQCVDGNGKKHKEEGERTYELGQYGFGKSHIKLLHVHRVGAFHTIREYEVDTHLRLQSTKDFIAGDNKDIIATDTQKNTVYVLAKKYGVSTASFNRHLNTRFLVCFGEMLLREGCNKYTVTTGGIVTQCFITSLHHILTMWWKDLKY
jgi:hypothetical protein